jgi:hypothetical protein
MKLLAALTGDWRESTGKSGPTGACYLNGNRSDHPEAFLAVVGSTMIARHLCHRRGKFGVHVNLFF